VACLFAGDEHVVTGLAGFCTDALSGGDPSRHARPRPAVSRDLSTDATESSTAVGQAQQNRREKERGGNKGRCGDRFLLKTLGDMPEKITTP
jgi:hypothetical protein